MLHNKAINSIISQKQIVLLALNDLKGFGSKTIIDLFEQYMKRAEEYEFNIDSFVDFLEHKQSLELEQIEQLTDNIWKVERELSKDVMKDISIVSFFDDLYPYQLKLLKNPPLFLFCKGNIDLLRNDNNIAVVGTRENSKIGELVATKTAEYFASKEFNIVSGLAKGIDTYGHIGALNAHGKTIAVLTDLIKIYPAENRDLADQILQEGGLLFSEIAPWKSAYRSTFVDRDRLQSGMSLATFVIETDIVGGTMHTVKFTIEQERLLFVPDFTLLKYENGFSKINGTKHLLETKKARSYCKDSYPQILEELHLKKNDLKKMYEIKLQNKRGLL